MSVPEPVPFAVVGQMTLFGPDWSNNNWASTSQAIAACQSVAQTEGYSWIEHKVSEGNYYADPYWPPVRDWCNQNNVPVIGYHYVTTNDAASQAAQWKAGGGGPNAMLDFEANSGDIGNFWAVVAAFNNIGVNVALSYIPHWYWQQIGSPDISKVPGLVSSSYVGRGTYASALYPGNTGAGWASYGGATPVIWQFTDGASMAGISADANAFEGNIDELRSLLGLTPTPGVFMALTDQQQQQLFDAVLDIQTQLRGPGLGGWSQLGQNPAGENLTVVDALADVKDQVFGIPTAPKGA